jgi:hypothetical protein
MTIPITPTHILVKHRKRTLEYTERLLVNFAQLSEGCSMPRNANRELGQRRMGCIQLIVVILVVVVYLIELVMTAVFIPLPDAAVQGEDGGGGGP